MNDTQRINDRNLREALDLIKNHITAADTAQNRELTYAVSLIVDAGRAFGMLDPAESARLYRESLAAALKACTGAREVTVREEGPQAAPPQEWRTAAQEVK